jgi:hypothetical protein
MRPDGSNQWNERINKQDWLMLCEAAHLVRSQRASAMSLGRTVKAASMKASVRFISMTAGIMEIAEPVWHRAISPLFQQARVRACAEISSSLESASRM